MRLIALLLLITCCPFAWGNQVLERYFKSTYQGLEAMRNSTSGLVVDSTLADMSVLNDNTSPSNIGLDLLVQMEAVSMPEYAARARSNIQKILKTLKQLPFHPDSGLFFNRYSSDGHQVSDKYVSSVDNLHLAFALWVLRVHHPIAASIFKRLNFMSLYDPHTGLFSGGFYYLNDRWNLERWNYDYFGSEGRSLYSIGHAIGLIQDPHFPAKTIKSMMLETNGNLLRLWDGGAFQMLLPRLLVKEEMYSDVMQNFFMAYANFVLKEGQRLQLPVPASHSASQVSIHDYNGKAGNPALVATQNQDIEVPYLRQKWDAVFTPHAAFIALPIMPKEITQSLQNAENLGEDFKFYVEGLGWLDGLHLKGSEKGKVVPVYLSLDQTMIALSLAQVLAPDQMTVGNRALFEHPEANYRIQNFYQSLIREKLPLSWANSVEELMP